MNVRGQVLLPALAGFLVVITGFFGMVQLGKTVLTQMRLQTAAEAAALSSARTEAEMLNKLATHNLGINVFVPLSYRGVGAMQIDMRKSFKIWLQLERYFLPQSQFLALQKGFCISTGRTVAKLNGADPGAPFLLYPDGFQLQTRDMEVVLVKGITPVGLAKFEDAYYARSWEPNIRAAQPTHKTAWLAKKGNLKAAGSARLYLDLKNNAPLHNGGFPRADEKLWSWGNAEIQSCYPQFNARLISPSKGIQWLLEGEKWMRI